jgi:GIY-YIG catalytic domain
MTLVYALHAPNGEIRYVGKTTESAPARLSRHLAASRRGRVQHVNNWIRSVDYCVTISVLAENPADFGSGM